MVPTTLMLFHEMLEPLHYYLVEMLNMHIGFEGFMQLSPVPSVRYMSKAL